MRITHIADVANLITGTTVVAPSALAAIPAPVSDASKELLTVLVGIVSMLLTKAAGKLFDKWFGDKKEKPTPTAEPQPETLTLEKTNDDEKTISK
jgi:hypothetical protein